MGRGVSGGTDGLHSLIRLHRFLAGDTASWIGRGAITKGNPPHDAHPYAGRGRRGDLLTAGYTDCRGAAFIRQSAIDVEKSASHHLSLLEKSAPGILYLLSLLSRSGTNIGCAPDSSFRASLSAVSHSCRASSFRPMAASASPRASCPNIDDGSIATASSASANAPAALPLPATSIAFCARLSAAAGLISNRPR